MKKNHICLLLLPLAAILLALLFGPRRAEGSIQQDLADHILRLHIIGASDSETDQAHKLLVRDAVLEAIAPCMEEIHSKEDAIAILTEKKSLIEDAARRALSDAGDDSSVTVSLEHVFFPVKSYGVLTFPCGYYDSLQICIGDHTGQNWWCVLYPALCFIDATCVTVPNDSLDTLQEDLTEESYSSLFPSESQKKPVFRFRYLTFLNWLFE